MFIGLSVYRIKTFYIVNIQNVIVCMPHRGRNNLLVCLLNYPAATMFRKIKGKNEFPKDVKTTGDVLSHLCKFNFQEFLLLNYIFRFIYGFNLRWKNTSYFTYS